MIEVVLGSILVSLIITGGFVIIGSAAWLSEKIWDKLMPNRYHFGPYFLTAMGISITGLILYGSTIAYLMGVR